jgi:NhaP-type Na+/H+ or K+/H+ antiporter
MTRVVIGIQLVMAGYQLPMKYPWHRWRDMALLLIPVMTIMWLCTTGCIKLMVPKLTLLTAMVSFPRSRNIHLTTANISHDPGYWLTGDID